MFKDNKLNMALALIVAIMLWFYVAGGVNPQTSKRVSDVEIEFINEDALIDEDLAMSASDYETVDVTITGSRSDVNKIEKNDIKVTADLNNCHKGKNTITLKASLPKETELPKVAPETIDVIIEERITESKPVDVKFDGETEEGKEPGDINVTPENVQVTGARSLVESVEKVEATVPIDEVQGSEHIVQAKVTPRSKSGDKVKGLSLSTKSVDVSATMMQTKSVALDVKTTGEVAEGMQIDSISLPDKITIKGEEDTVDGINKVSAADVDISAVKKSVSLLIDVDLPDGIELADESKDVSCKIVLKELATHTLEISSSKIKTGGLPYGLKATVAEKTITVIIKGDDETMENITEDDISLSIDLANATEGTHSFKIKATCVKDVAKMQLDPKKVDVKIRKD